MSHSLIYITAADETEAKALGRALVEARLAACANVLPGITPIYWWEGKVEEGAEVALIAKTRADLVPRIVEFVTRRHSYDCPCVVALPITGGNPAFLAWIDAETAGAEG
jgi:periplasmic divalent cation tolerance protein